MLKESRRTPGRKKIKHPPEAASWPTPGMGKLHDRLRQQAAEATETLFLPPICSTPKPSLLLLTLHEDTWGRGSWRSGGGCIRQGELVEDSAHSGTASKPSAVQLSSQPAPFSLSVLCWGRSRVSSHSLGFCQHCWEASSRL